MQAVLFMGGPADGVQLNMKALKPFYQFPFLPDTYRLQYFHLGGRNYYAYTLIDEKRKKLC